MNTKTGLLALGLFTLGGILTVSCGGSSGSDDENTTAGKTSTGGATSTAGTTSGAGATSTAGSGNNTAGSDNTAGTANNNGGAGNNNNGGAGNDNQGGDNNFPGFGGAGTVPGCPADQPANDATCMREGFNRFGCPYNDGAIVCSCEGPQQMRVWNCDAPDQGQGGADGGFGQATCPADADVGADCSDGPGLCSNQNCICGENDKISFCFGG